MRLVVAARSLGSGVLVYLVMAACGSSDSAVATMLDGGDGDAVIDALIDGVVSPEDEASAGPLPPDVATEPCNKSGAIGPTGAVYAVHTYSGKTVNDLSAVRIVTHAAPSSSKHTIEGATYEFGGGVPLLRDGAVAVFCGTTGASSYDSVTFILPQ